MNRELKSIITNGTIIAVLSLLIFFASTFWRMNSQFNRGEEALHRGDFAAAVAGFESAIHMYIPFHPTVEDSAKRLWQIGEANEKLGDINRALIAYRSLRSSFYADSWLVTPGQQWIDRCDKKIAALIPLQREK
ncbi:MAG: hypothetical protein PHN84_09540 [Desulfuromonadaceae bacterium]|nr:hypothetical protein [Desulfuromonadaceae bacterium]MDD2856768.1 hypothetical protein [Desulfuromonadaceae bacterium]